MERVAHLARRALGLSPGAPRHDWLKEDRTCVANDAAANAAYCSNVVVTSKYTLLNFWPVFLLEQFSRFANFYFLVVCVLQSIKAISITAGLPTTALPLTIVIGFDAAVTAMEDIKRHKDDHRANTSRTLTMRGGRFSEVSWSELRVGDLLKVRRNEALPADCIFLASSSTDNDTPESCYVQTAQLDGETNLKLKQALAATPEVFASDAACAAFRGRVVCEAPNANFDKFTGMLHLQSAAGGDAQLPLPLEADQMLLRGCILRNVDSAYALVVYTGRETKVRVRQTTRARKVAQVEQMLNKLIAMLVATLVLACALGAIGAAAWSDAFSTPGWYLRQVATGPIDPSNSTVVSGAEIIKQFFTFFLLNSSIIPVSLYVSVRLARTLQSVVMQWDREMFHDEPALFAASGGLEGEYPFKVRSMDLNDELGQITHIFSDKTGTLTLNYMEFRKLLVRGVAYGLGTTQIGVDRLRREGRDVTALRAQLLAEEAERKAGGGRPVVPHVNFTDGSETHPGHTLEADGADPRDGAQGAAVFSFLVHLAVNHNVLRETVRNHAGDVIGSRLSASSPDEEAFLFATDSFGLSFISRAHELALLRYRTGSARLPFARASRPLPAALRLASDAAIKKAMPAVGAGEGGAVLPVRLLATLAYSQERKRMSVIVQLPVLDSDGTPVLAPRSVADAESARVSGDIVLFCKGADSVILERLATGAGASSLDDYEVLQRSKRQMAEWGNDGLRTLCFASRVIPAQAFAEWQRRYQAACADLGEVQRRKAKQANRIDELMAEVESGLTLQGATANEDKLQPEVPETIALLAKGGVKIWMVTGDKQETAVNIGFATRLLDDTMRQVVATAESAGSTTAAMRRLRIAAKRMRAERLEDLARSAASASSFEAAIKWVGKQVEAAEAAMGVSPEAGAHTDIDIDAAELIMEADFDETGKMRPTLHRLATKASFRRSNSKRIITNAAGAGSPRQGGGSGNGAPPFSGSSVKPAAEEADASSLTSSSRRERENSLDSDDGEAAIAHADGNVALEAMGGAGAVPAPPPAAGGYSNPLRSPQARVAAVKLASEAIAPVLGQQRRPFALVIDEHALDTALSHPRLRAYLLYVAVNCGAVIACRARPDQKASVVRLIRHGVATSRTLAVGDGANDVDMIGTAHVGVGISGAEGVQAANASDYAIGRFRFLQRLLLVHGRWNYMRMSKLVLYMFWKNIFFVMSQVRTRRVRELRASSPLVRARGHATHTALPFPRLPPAVRLPGDERLHGPEVVHRVRQPDLQPHLQQPAHHHPGRLRPRPRRELGAALPEALRLLAPQPRPQRARLRLVVRRRLRLRHPQHHLHAGLLLRTRRGQPLRRRRHALHLLHGRARLHELRHRALAARGRGDEPPLLLLPGHPAALGTAVGAGRLPLRRARGALHDHLRLHVRRRPGHLRLGGLLALDAALQRHAGRQDDGLEGLQALCLARAAPHRAGGGRVHARHEEHRRVHGNRRPRAPHGQVLR